MGTNTSSYESYGNPVLNDFVGFTIQPYWLIIAELFFLQIMQRTYSLIESVCKKKRKNIYIALELAVLGYKRTGVSPPKYSVLDFVLSLISIGHFFYACYLQTKCMSAPNASTWRCYNAFGYRLYNYILPSIVSILVESIVELVNTYRAYKKDQDKVMNDDMRQVKWFLLGSSIVMNSAVFLVFIPFFVSNVVPMLIAYVWVLVPLLIALVLTYAIFITSVVNAIRQCKDCSCIYCGKFFATHCIVGLQVFGCLIMSMAYNYSQYSFFGADYSSVIWYEYQSRDTAAWFNSLTNSTELDIQNVLAPF